MIERRYLADFEIIAEERGEARGKEIGKEIGEARGKEIGQRELLLHLLERRFRRLRKAGRLALTELPAQHVPALAEALFDFQSITDLRAWLTAQGKDEG